jgi:hypothetical protein
MEAQNTKNTQICLSKKRKAKIVSILEFTLHYGARITNTAWF